METNEVEANGVEANDTNEVETIEEIAQVHQVEEEALTISESLAKTHFPELLNEPQEVYEVIEQGQVVEQWYTVEPEKAASNVEVLEKLENEVQTEEDKADIKKLLAWAKSSGTKIEVKIVLISIDRATIFALQSRVGPILQKMSVAFRRDTTAVGVPWKVPYEI